MAALAFADLGGIGGIKVPSFGKCLAIVFIDISFHSSASVSTLFLEEGVEISCIQ